MWRCKHPNRTWLQAFALDLSGEREAPAELTDAIAADLSRANGVTVYFQGSGVVLQPVEAGLPERLTFLSGYRSLLHESAL